MAGHHRQQDLGDDADRRAQGERPEPHRGHARGHVDHHEGSGRHEPHDQAGQEAVLADHGHEALQLLSADLPQQPPTGDAAQPEADAGGDHGADPTIGEAKHRPEGDDGGGDQHHLGHAGEGQDGEGRDGDQQGKWAPGRHGQPVAHRPLPAPAQRRNGDHEDQAGPAEQQEGDHHRPPGAGVHVEDEADQPTHGRAVADPPSAVKPGRRNSLAARSERPAGPRGSGSGPPVR